MMKPMRFLVVAAALGGSAWAQPVSGGGYDPDRPCHDYMMHHLPAPLRCTDEFIKRGASPYVDGDFLFLSRSEWLAWRDREDYRHWRKRDYAWHAGMAEAAAPPPPPLSVPVAAPPALSTAPASAALLCPAELPARIVIDRKALGGWNADDRDVLLKLDRSEPPRADEGTLTCTYTFGHERLTITRPTWGHCTARADRAGFDCVP